MTGAQRWRLTVVAVAVLLAALLWQVHPVLALGPLIVPGAPAALLLCAGRGGRDPYDVMHLYEGDEPAARRRRQRLGLDD